MKLYRPDEVVKHLAQKSNAQKILKQQLPLVHEGGTYVYVPGGTRNPVTMVGLTTAMSKYLYAPLQAVKKRARKPAETPAAKLKRQRSKARQVALRAKLTVQQRMMMSLKGRVRGSLIHRHIMDRLTLDDENFLRRNTTGIHPWARRLLEVFVGRGWHPIAAEFPALDANINMATQNDLVAVDESGKLVFIEDKTGYADDAFNQVDAVWSFELPAALRGRFPCTPRNRAIVQATLGALMAVSRLRLEDDAFSVWVARIDDSTVELFPVKQSFLHLVAIHIYPYLGKRLLAKE
jgi:hypothetical protein